MSTTTTTPARTTWKIDPAHSDVEFGVRHLMISTVKGRFPGVDGTVVMDESNPSNAEVDVRIDAATIDTREPGATRTCAPAIFSTSRSSRTSRSRAGALRIRTASTSSSPAI